MVELARRSFLKGLGATLFVAPAIVRASSLMPVKAFVDDSWNSADIVKLLEARLDVYDGTHDDRVYVRFDGYEPINFDVSEFRWKRSGIWVT